MNYFYLLALCTCLSVGNLYAQNNPLIMDIIDPSGINHKLSQGKPYEEATGSAYYQSSWLNGTLINKDGQVYANQVFKLDLYTQQIVLKQQDKITRLATDYIVGFDLMDTEELRERRFALAKSSDGLGDVYYEVLHLQEWALVKTHSREVLEIFDGARTYGSSQSLKFVNVGKVYLKKSKDAKPVRFDVSWSHIISLFPEFDKDIKAFVRYNDLSIHQDQDLVALVKHLEQLHAKMQH